MSLPNVLVGLDGVSRSTGYPIVDEVARDRKFVEVELEHVNAHTKESTHHFSVLNTHTGDLYVDDSMLTVAVKCVLVALVSPVFAVARMWWYGAKALIVTGTVACKAIPLLGEAIKERDGKKAVASWKEVKTIPSKVGTCIAKVVAAPLYFIAMELGAMYGIFDPFNGREIVAHVEQHMNGGVSRKYDVRHADIEESLPLFKRIQDLYTKSQAFYLAYCFQPKGNLFSHPDEYKILQCHLPKICD